MTEAQTPPAITPKTASSRSWRDVIASTEIDTRLLGMVVALVLIWIGFHVMSHGAFLTSRNLWNLSVQSASIAIMATGMVLIIVSRNIDLSVGSLLGFLGYTMAIVQTDWLPKTFGLGLERPYTWIIALVVGIALGAVIGAVQGFIIAYGGVPAFIVTLGGFLVWRGLIFRLGKKGQTLAPLDHNFQLLGGGSKGSLGDWKSWLLALVACLGITASLALARRNRRRYDLPVRSIGVDVGIGIVGCLVVIGGIGLVANRYDSPITGKPTGVAYPVVILIVVTLAMTYLARRRRFGRYVYAYGGNPEAAELGGINTRKTIMLTFVLMGVLCALSAAVQTAATQRCGHEPRRAERARRHRRRRDRWHVVLGRDRHDPGSRARSRHHAVAAIRNGPAQDRLTVARHRGRRGTRHRRRRRRGAPPTPQDQRHRRIDHRLGRVGHRHPNRPRLRQGVRRP